MGVNPRLTAMFIGIVGAIHESPATHPVGKSYAINIEAEKMTFSELSNIVVEHLCNWRAATEMLDFCLLLDYNSTVKTSR